MEEYFVHKCVTTDVVAANCEADGGDVVPQTISSWTSTGRCELVLVQESLQAHGASRAVLASILAMTLRSAYTSNVLAFTLDSPALVAHAAPGKLVHMDYSSDASLFRPTSTQSGGATTSLLLSKMREQVERVLAAVVTSPSHSARPVVILIDSLDVLLQLTTLQRVLLFLHQLRQHPKVGSVITRINASTQPPATAQVLSAAATTVVMVETPSSLKAYRILAKERRREIPPTMHGLVLLIRQKKNGRASESLEYFQITGNAMNFYAAEHAENHARDTETKTQQAAPDKTKQQDRSLNSSEAGKPPSVASLSITPQVPLPVRPEEVSFNLNISLEEQLAKRKVQLPYTHQGSATSKPSSDQGNSSSNAVNRANLFFIDEDDPDWDDDDLDDDLDVQFVASEPRGTRIFSLPGVVYFCL